MCGATCRVTHALQGSSQVQGAVAYLALANSLKTNTCLTELELVSEGSRGDDMMMDCVGVIIYSIVLFITVFLFSFVVFL